MKLGLYRIRESYLGECAKVQWNGGDAAAFLPRELYETLGYEPDFDSLELCEVPKADGTAREGWYLTR